MKKRILYLFIGLMLILSACEKATTVEEPASDRTLELTIQNEQLRSFIKDPNVDQVLFRWDEGMTDIQMVFKQGDVLAHISGVQDEKLNEEGHVNFLVTIPNSIDVTKSFDLYGVVADRVKVERGKVLVGVEAHSTYELLASSPNRDSNVPVYFELKGVSAQQKRLSATFKHLGAMAVITVKNSSDEPLTTAGFTIEPKESVVPFYHKGALPFEGNTELPFLDLLNLTAEPEMIASNVDYPMVEVSAGDVMHVGFWFMPTASMASDAELVVYQWSGTKGERTAVSLPSRAIKVGEAYSIFAEWNGVALNLLEEEPLLPMPSDLPMATFETSKGAGELIYIGALPKDRNSERYTFVDLNGNGVADKGEYITDFTKDIMDNKVSPFQLQSSKFTIYGDVEILQVIDAGITKADLSEMPQVRVVDFWKNNLTSIDLSSNTLLNTVAIEENKLTEVMFPAKNRIQFLFLSENKLDALNVSDLTGLIEAYINNNELDAAALNQIYSDLPEAKDKSATWKYKLSVYNNPGVNAANDNLAKVKGWTLYKSKK